MFIACTVVATLFPFYWTITLATQNTATGGEPEFLYVPSFDAFAAVWSNSDFVGSLVMSMIVVVLTVIISLVVTVPAAYAFVRFELRPRTGIVLWLLLAYLLPDFLIAIPMYVLLQNVGLYDTSFGLALAYQVFMVPLAMWLLLRFFEDVPAEVAEAASIDGASRMQTLLRVYLPVVRPGIATTAVLIAITVWNEVTIALSLTLNNPTVPIAIAAYKGYASIQWDQLAAASLIAMAPVVIFAIFAQKHIVSGLTAGAGK
ncbi:carbohydrate ABC transporter permease [Phytoactinopolyspora endophytica]|uniref:carbohydrate ABC transporter permease n=1 Tax=Phytoactinopolyspora endophytica TaxID=1642495 RepID=UPI0013ED3D25|nr:carbohydrate ABC transporter permease [Phytoactinopolyspora endophytica]